MTQSEIEALLGRSLTSIESANRELYLNIAKEKVESLLCLSLDVHAEGAAASVRTFEPREGYSTVFTGIFTSVSSVTVDGEAETDFTKKFWDNPNTSYFNSLVFDDIPEGDVAVTAVWGFSTLPSDLSQLWVQAFAKVSQKRLGNVKSKRVEDFSITYGDLSDVEQFVKDNSGVIRKYSLCTVGNIRHGEIE